MFSVTTLVAAAAASLLVGLGLGWWIGGRKPVGDDVVRDLEARLDRAVQERNDYESEVREHFSRTAELLNRLTEDYRSVYQHVATGAEQLCDGEVVVPANALGTRDDGEIPPQLVEVQQPLDYAPRRSPDEHGQLAEDFGLEKTATPIAPSEKASA
jgi:uncharacterized membrane-anchored protein YhcB (DUF1043 family)